MARGKVTFTFLSINFVLLVVFSALVLSKLVYVGFCSDKVITVNPGESINAALNTANDGDTILVKSGSYSESGILVNKSVTIVGENEENTIIDGGGTTQDIFHVTANNVVIENLTLQNTNFTAYPPAPAARLFNVANVTLQKIVIKSVGYGAEIWSSNFTEIRGSRILNATTGIRIRSNSYNNTVVDNSLENNSIAISIVDNTCNYNKIFHNDFVNNKNPPTVLGSSNLFDNGYPSGGNYWDDFNASDLNSGPYPQNEAGGDGILDEAYPDSLSAWDKYPFAHPITNIEVTADGNRFTVQISTNSTLTSYSFNQSAQSLTLIVSGPSDTNGSCRIAVPRGLLVAESLDNWTILLYNGGGERVTPQWIFNDTENTYIYFTYSHAFTSRIEIGIVVAEHYNVLTLIFTASTITLVTFKKRLKDKNPKS
jgi:hypothetical protein